MFHHSAQHFPLLNTYPMRAIFYDFHVRILTHLMVNHGRDALVAYTLTLQEWQQLREMERRYTTHVAGEPVASSLIDLMSLMNAYFGFDSAIDHTCERAGNSGAFLISEELPQPELTSTIPTDESSAADLTRVENGQLQGSIKESPRPPAVSRRTRFHAGFTFSCHQGEPCRTNYHKKNSLEIITK
jgi:hypothetical protein